MHYSIIFSYERYRERRSLLLSLMERLRNVVEALDISALRGEVEYARDLLNSHSLKVLVAGGLNSGKSTIVNALLRIKALPTYPVPTTALLTHVKRGRQAMAFLHYPTSDGTQQPPLEVASGDIERHLVLEHNSEYTRDFERVEIHLPLPPRFRGIEIIDPISPWDDDGYEESLASQVPNADAIIYAFDSDVLPSREEALQIDWVQRASSVAPLFLCNRFDLIEPHRQKLVKRRYADYLSQLLRENGDFLFFTDAKSALEGYLQGDAQRLEQSQMPQVEDTLYDYLARGSGEQSVLRAVANLQSLVSQTRQIIAVKKGLQQTPVRERKEARTKLLRQCKQLETRRRHIADQFHAARQGIGKEAKTAATAFYRACLSGLERTMRGYALHSANSLWYVFSGDASERSAKDILTFLAETTRDQFSAWITTTLEPLLQNGLSPLSAELQQDMVRQIAQVVERRTNCSWHPARVLKRMLEVALQQTDNAPLEMKTRVIHVYRCELEKSTLSLVAMIIDSIDSALCQRERELDHRLAVELHCLSDIVRTSVEDEQEQSYGGTSADMQLLPALEDELQAIERVLVDLV